MALVSTLSAVQPSKPRRNFGSQPMEGAHLPRTRALRGDAHWNSPNPWSLGGGQIAGQAAKCAGAQLSTGDGKFPTCLTIGCAGFAHAQAAQAMNNLCLYRCLWSVIDKQRAGWCFQPIQKIYQQIGESPS